MGLFQTLKLKAIRWIPMNGQNFWQIPNMIDLFEYVVFNYLCILIVV